MNSIITYENILTMSNAETAPFMLHKIRKNETNLPID